MELSMEKLVNESYIGRFLYCLLTTAKIYFIITFLPDIVFGICQALQNQNLSTISRGIGDYFSMWPLHIALVLLYSPFVVVCHARQQFTFVYRGLLSYLIGVVFYGCVVIAFVSGMELIGIMVGLGIFFWLACRPVKG